MSPKNKVTAERKGSSDFAKKLEELRKSVPDGYARSDFHRMRYLILRIIWM